jgi:hypothetical protein
MWDGWPACTSLATAAMDGRRLWNILFLHLLPNIHIIVEDVGNFVRWQDHGWSLG